MNWEIDNYATGKPLDAIQSAAEKAFRNAQQIVKGGSAAASDYAKAAYARLPTFAYTQASPVRRAAMERSRADDALACAKVIVGKHRKAWWVATNDHGHKLMCVVTLIPESSGATHAYLPYFEARTDSAGRIVEYHADATQDGTPIWRAA